MSEKPLNDAVVVHATHKLPRYRIVIDQAEHDDLGVYQLTTVERAKTLDALGKPIWTEVEDMLVLRMAEDLVDALGVRPDWDDGERPD